VFFTPTLRAVFALLNQRRWSSSRAGGGGVHRNPP
jgi:hypothetical protein